MLTRYFLIAFVLCWALTLPIALHTQGWIPTRILPSQLQWLIGVVPIFAAWWVTRGTAERKPWLENSFRVRVSPVWYVVALALPWLILLVALGVTAAAGRELPRIGYSPQLFAFALLWFVLALGEEAGWRSFALPHMLRTRGFFITATVLGVIWCVWHYPKFFANPYFKPDAQGFTMMGLFSLQIIIANYLICWLYLRTRSAILTSVFHMSWNVLSTAYMMAAVDMFVTGASLAAAVAVLVFDRKTLMDVEK
jgi:uncharacterized protein